METETILLMNSIDLQEKYYAILVASFKGTEKKELTKRRFTKKMC